MESAQADPKKTVHLKSTINAAPMGRVIEAPIVRGWNEKYKDRVEQRNSYTVNVSHRRQPRQSGSVGINPNSKQKERWRRHRGAAAGGGGFGENSNI